MGDGRETSFGGGSKAMSIASHDDRAGQDEVVGADRRSEPARGCSLSAFLFQVIPDLTT
jgi:hypothetical protein